PPPPPPPTALCACLPFQAIFSDNENTLAAAPAVLTGAAVVGTIRSMSDLPGDRFLDPPGAMLLDLDDTIIDDTGSVVAGWHAACEAFSDRIGVEAPRLYAAIDERRTWFWADAERHRIGCQDLRAASAPFTPSASGVPSRWGDWPGARRDLPVGDQRRYWSRGLVPSFWVGARATGQSPLPRSHSPQDGAPG
ncbi:MAG: hypothetical protein ACKVVP_14485, partial [Chloroflexota bacterium]